MKTISEMSQNEISRSLLIFMGTQVVLGAVFSLLNLERTEWIKELLFPLERSLPTFRSAFAQSATPVASKLLLATWWTLFIPWGLWWSFRVTNGFKPDPAAAKNTGFLNLLGIYAAAIFSTWMFGSLLSTHDHSYYFLNNKPNSPARGDIVPELMSNGCLTLSLWLAVSSVMLCLAIDALIMIPRAIVRKFAFSS